MRRKKRTNIFVNLLKAFCISFIFFSVLAIVGNFGFQYATSQNKHIFKSSEGNSVDSNEIIFAKLSKEVPEHTVFAILATDNEESRTDTMLVGVFNSKTYQIDLLSIPRDTYVVMPKYRLDFLAKNGLRTASVDGVMKMGEVYHHAGSKFGISLTIAQLEDLLGIQIPYYVQINLEGFRRIIDTIGGVEFDVPQRMYYRDPTQDLYIDLEPGIQRLTGEQAEGLVRYRKSDSFNPISPGYAQGDITRIEVQQAFIKALLNQFLNRDNIMENAPAIISMIFQDIRTNFSIRDIPKYAIFIGKLNGEHLRTHTLPGVAQTIGNKSFYILDENASIELVQNIFTLPQVTQ